MKQLLAFLLLISFMAQTFSQAFIIADYYINTSSFAKDCVNKSMPKMKCNGKCQMMKKLKEQEKKEQQEPERKTEYKSISVSPESYFATLDYTGSLKKIFYPSQSAMFPIGTSSDVFHPPQA